MRSLLQSKTARLADVDGGPPGRLLVKSDVTGTVQLYDLRSDAEHTPLEAVPAGRQLAFLDKFLQDPALEG